MGIKVVRRSQVIYHGIFLILFSIVLHYLVNVILSKNSLLNTEMFIGYLSENKILMGLALISSGLIFFGKRLGFYAVTLLCLFVIGLFIQDYYLSSNKGILVTGFIYMLCSYFVILSLYFEYSSPPFSPGYVANQIDNRKLPNIEIAGVDESGREYRGRLIKIAVDSFYAIDRYGEKIRGSLSARITFEGINFECLAWEVTKSDGGRGFRVNTTNSESPISWYNFYRILKDRGYYFE
jgi:hypothetical protein